MYKLIPCLKGNVSITIKSQLKKMRSIQSAQDSFCFSSSEAASTRKRKTGYFGKFVRGIIVKTLCKCKKKKKDCQFFILRDIPLQWIKQMIILNFGEFLSFIVYFLPFYKTYCGQHQRNKSPDRRAKRQVCNIFSVFFLEMVIKDEFSSLI